MSTTSSGAAPTGPILFAYDGSTTAALAIERAGREFASGRDAFVVCVWQPADVGFEPVTERHFDPNVADEVHHAAEETAVFGASLAQTAGFRAQALTKNAAPTWEGIIHTAEEHGASVIVLGAHRHTGLIGHLLGNVSTAVVSHATCSVLVVHPES